MTKLQIDFENPGRGWWDAGGRALWEALTGDPDESSVVVDDDVASSWLREAAQIPGWDGGPEFAPHPIASSLLNPDEADL